MAGRISELAPRRRRRMMLAYTFGSVYGCGSLFVLILDVVAIVQIAESGRATARKVLWILLVIFFPLIGAILWFLLGKK
jgi:hypothetical protein